MRRPSANGIALRGGGVMRDDEGVRMDDGEYFGMDNESENEELVYYFQWHAQDRERHLRKYRAQQDGDEGYDEEEEEQSQSQPPRQRKPIVLPDGDYKLREPDPHRKRKLAVLGIDESLVEPADSPSSGRWRWGGGRRSLVQLQGAAWRPTQMRFVMQWPAGELPSDWFEILYVHLFVRVARFAERYIEHGDIDAEGEGSVWAARGFSEQFVYYAGLVARQDNLAGGWDHLLTSRLHRKYLVMGVIAKVLETSVFDKLLFGASEAQLDVLAAEDEATLEVDGYHRTALRSRSVRVLMAGDTLTPFFWDDVDLLTMQLTRLLLPLIELLDEHFAASRDQSLRNIYQDLHHIVAEAAYLSIAIRWSKNIWRFSTPLPGQPWDMDQAHVDDSIYEFSKKQVTRQDELDEKKWTEDQKHAKARQDASASPGGVFKRLSYPLRAASAMVGKGLTWSGLRALPGYRHEPPAVVGDFWYPPSRIAKVQIVLWPMLQRYVTVGELGDNPAAEAPEGETITTVFHAQVVYYVGKINAVEEQAETVPTLQQWVAHKTRERFWRLWVRWVVLLAASVFAIATLLYVFTSPGGGATPELVNTIYDVVSYGVVRAQDLFGLATSAVFGV
ncbi:hypothetical protein B0T22DRAFT_533829 [Podospora appendiculata]|uniref:Uncharacterized protein n=1 Tax=Podospora appendiculata TaxID=314037 RepID=A0AAE1CHH7_9PEZI|nr:hypothetical protein B0T22DRAFT_533829 [Podospora appendiculata]